MTENEEKIIEAISNQAQTIDTLTNLIERLSRIVGGIMDRIEAIEKASQNTK